MNLYDQAAQSGIRLVTFNGLIVPLSYLCLTKRQKEQICNGCGPGWLGYIVPDKPFGFNLEEACNIHDYCFNNFRCTFDLANNIFEYNLHILVRRHPQNAWRLGYWIIGKYIGAVKSWWGRYHFWRVRS